MVSWSSGFWLVTIVLFIWYVLCRIWYRQTILQAVKFCISVVVSHLKVIDDKHFHLNDDLWNRLINYLLITNSNFLMFFIFNMFGKIKPFSVHNQTMDETHKIIFVIPDPTSDPGEFLKSLRNLRKHKFFTSIFVI